MFYNDPTNPEIYTLSLHDALPIFNFVPTPSVPETITGSLYLNDVNSNNPANAPTSPNTRSEEHTSELQSRGHLVCRLLLEKKNILTQLYDKDLNNRYVTRVLSFLR